MGNISKRAKIYNLTTITDSDISDECVVSDFACVDKTYMQHGSSVENFHIRIILKLGDIHILVKIRWFLHQHRKFHVHFMECNDWCG